MSDNVRLLIFRGGASGGEEKEYVVPKTPGMVVLDAVRLVQEQQDGTLAIRWNCKAAKCGSCAAEINGHPRLMCKTRVEDVMGPDGVIRVHPIKTFPVIRDLVTDVSWNYERAAKIPPLAMTGTSETPRIPQSDVTRIQEFRKCIECYLCQTVCHVLRDHARKDAYYGPRFMVKLAALDMHPLDILRRREFIKSEAGVGYCNITKCCQEVCPEEIHITDNAIIPLKERVADEYYDPLRSLLRRLLGRKG